MESFPPTPTVMLPASVSMQLHCYECSDAVLKCGSGKKTQRLSEPSRHTHRGSFPQCTNKRRRRRRWQKKHNYHSHDKCEAWTWRRQSCSDANLLHFSNVVWSKSNESITTLAEAAVKWWGITLGFIAASKHPNIQSACSLCSRLTGAGAAAGEMCHGEAASLSAGEALAHGGI